MVYVLLYYITGKFFIRVTKLPRDSFKYTIIDGTKICLLIKCEVTQFID